MIVDSPIVGLEVRRTSVSQKIRSLSLVASILMVSAISPPILLKSFLLSHPYIE